MFIIVNISALDVHNSKSWLTIPDLEIYLLINCPCVDLDIFHISVNGILVCVASGFASLCSPLVITLSNPKLKVLALHTCLIAFKIEVIIFWQIGTNETESSP